MLGAIIGDIAGSRFEFNNMFDYGFEMFSDKCSYTDDTICTVAVADAIINGKSYKNSMLKWCLKYPYPMGGYGSMFFKWIRSTNPQPYGSFGNGATMRVSPVGWLFSTEEEVVAQARATAAITHNHLEGIRGAAAVALGIFLLRTGVDFETVIDKCMVSNYGERWQDGLPAKGKFDGSCQGCVPLAFRILDESSDFEDAVRRAVSYGGDCDTVGAIVGSLAEARWSVPYWMKYRAMLYLPEEMWYIYDQFRMKARRWVVTKNFFRPVNTKNTKRDSALYRNELGWCSADYHDAMTTDPEGILRYYLEMGYDFYLFDTATLRWYCIDNRYENRIALSKLRPKENWDGEYYEDSQGSVDWIHYNDIPDVIFKCKTVDQFLRGAAIDGTPISEVMIRSWIEYS